MIGEDQYIENYEENENFPSSPPVGITFKCEKYLDGLWFGVGNRNNKKVAHELYGLQWTDELGNLTEDVSIAFTSLGISIRKAAAGVRSLCLKGSCLEAMELCSGCSIRDLYKAGFTTKEFHIKIYTSSYKEAGWVKFGLRDLFDAMAVLMPTECLELLRPHTAQLLAHLQTIPVLAQFIPEATRRLESPLVPPLIRRKMLKDMAKDYEKLTKQHQQDDEPQTIEENAVVMGAVGVVKVQEVASSSTTNSRIATTTTTPNAGLKRVGTGKIQTTTDTLATTTWLKENYKFSEGSMSVRVQELYKNYVESCPHTNPFKDCTVSKLVYDTFHGVCNKRTTTGRMGTLASFYHGLKQKMPIKSNAIDTSGLSADMPKKPKLEDDGDEENFQ